MTLLPYPRPTRIKTVDELEVEAAVARMRATGADLMAKKR